jgi:nucleosome binding factor SPN SPT16 subunit
LVNLIELPFLVITLDEVELVYFERVSLSIKNFDMSFVFKDLNRPFIRITAIPMECLEMIKNWLDNVDILFSEGIINLNWTKIIQKIKKDPEEFINDGGWSFLMDEVIIINFRVVMRKMKDMVVTPISMNLNLKKMRKVSSQKRVNIVTLK